MPADPVTLVLWRDAKDNPPKDDRIVMTEYGMSHYAWSDWWVLDRDAARWTTRVAPAPRVWSAPSPPDLSDPLGPLTVEDLHSAVAACELVADDLQRVSYGRSANAATWRERAARLRRALDNLPKGP